MCGIWAIGIIETEEKIGGAHGKGAPRIFAHCTTLRRALVRR